MGNTIDVQLNLCQDGAIELCVATVLDSIPVPASCEARLLTGFANLLFESIVRLDYLSHTLQLFALYM